MVMLVYISFVIPAKAGIQKTGLGFESITELISASLIRELTHGLDF